MEKLVLEIGRQYVWDAPELFEGYAETRGYKKPNRVFFIVEPIKLHPVIEGLILCTFDNKSYSRQYLSVINDCEYLREICEDDLQYLSFI